MTGGGANRKPNRRSKFGQRAAARAIGHPAPGRLSSPRRRGVRRHAAGTRPAALGDSFGADTLTADLPPAGPSGPEPDAPGGGGGGDNGGGGGKRRRRRRSRRRGNRRRPTAPRGIDFGTDFSSLADFGPDGDPHVRPNRAGDPRTASAARVDADRVRLDPGLTEPAEPGGVRMTGFKRMYGRPDAAYARGRAAMQAGGGPVSPKLLGAAVLRGLAAETTDGSHEDFPVVVTVPHAFTQTPRQAVRDAGRLAGMDVTETLSETTAAALAWLWKDIGADGQPVGRTRQALIYDLGAGTFDAAVVRARRNDLQIVAAEGDPHLGGRDWTEALARDLAEEFRAEHGADPLGRATARRLLLGRSERAKLELSRARECVVEVTAGGRAAPLTVTRDRFESLTVDLLRRTRDLTEFLLENAGVEPDGLDVILPVGGAAAMPAVRRMLSDLFGPRASPDHAAGRAFPDPRTAVAEGAAVYAAMLRAHGDGPPPDVPARVRRRLRAVNVEEVGAHSVGIELEDPLVPGRSVNHVLLPRGARLPASVQMTFATTVDDAEGVRLRLVEGESPEAADCDRLGEYRVRGLPAGLPAGSPITVDITLDERNRPHVSAHRVRPAAELAADPTAAHDLAPLTVAPVVPDTAGEDLAKARERLARLMPHS